MTIKTIKRFDIIKQIGRQYLVSNIENDEFSYRQAFGSRWNKLDKTLVSSFDGRTEHSKLDIRFVDGVNHISILVETKDNNKNWSEDKIKQQLQAYVNCEKLLTGNRIIAIIATEEDKTFKVWWGTDIVIDDSHQLSNQYELKTFEEYADLYIGKENNKEKVIKSTYELNELLFKHGIDEKIRSQFVGTCLLALKHNCAYKNLQTSQIIAGIEGVLNQLLNGDINKATKLVLLNSKVLNSQDVKSLPPKDFEEILYKIETDILPYINDKNTMGQDILNLFFTTFNKYVGKTDKNQAFTPDHIVHFMCKVVGINRNSRILDPCCGSGAFLVRAMTEAMDDCANKDERDKVKQNQIYGIEYEETAFGLSTTNMLIHGDGNSNIRQGNCFEEKDFIENANINVVLMNPPYNAQKKYCLKEYADTWNKNTKEDPSQGFHFVYHIASQVKTGKLAVLLPLQCAIGTSSTDIQTFKTKMLEEHTLDAVFSLPVDVFHPGSTSVACCMIFNLGVRHKNANLPTFFGCFKDDGFVKRKNMGRIEKVKPNTNEGIWKDIEAKWLDLYYNRKSEAGLSVVKDVSAEDEWLAEAYMETDYAKITKKDFEKNIRALLASRLLQGKDFKKKNISLKNEIKPLRSEDWQYFTVEKLFSKENIISTKGSTTSKLFDGYDIPYISAKKELNGLEKMCSNETPEFVSKGNCIVFIQLGQGSAGYTTYQDDDFIGMYGKTTCAYHNKLNAYNGIFIETILDTERPKYSFGRSWTGSRLYQTQIKLPVKEGKDENGNIVYEPDWQYMEDYIKSLPYADLL